MLPPYEVPRLTVSNVPLAAADVDLIVIPIAQDLLPDAVSRYEGAVGDDLRSAVERGEFKAKANEIYTVRTRATEWRAAGVMFVGGGPRGEIGAERVRRMAVTAAQAARHQRRARVAWADVEPGTLAAASRLEIIADAFVVANFNSGVHKSRDHDEFFVREATVLASPESAGSVDSGRLTGEAINGARVLINEPGNYLPPSVMAVKASELGAVNGVTAEILDEKQIENLGMGMFLGVARGSAEPPRLLVLKYAPPGAAANRTLGLVGKGITFDTGGISIKPADGMERMKDDMAGGASVVAALRSIALQKLPIRVIAVVPMTENMPGGRATKPGDILKSASGLTVEVNNTDAEGRLILGDALWYARKLGATHLVDVATLTGAVVVALGKITTGLYGTPQPWVDHVRAGAVRAGEKVWPMPLFEDYRETLNSEIADMLNSPGRPAGSITAALFLKEFAGDGPWAHLDIAGTAWAEDAKSWQPKGATGVIIRTLVEVARGGFGV
jgi:leucyl aminopeptidase